jgi:3-deoxy-D-manno-octulosonic-acid transferase
MRNFSLPGALTADFTRGRTLRILMYPIYNLIYGAALAFVLPFEYRKRPAVIRKMWLAEKFGDIEKQYVPPSEGWTSCRIPTLWVHAVSVGEVIAASAFINEFKQKHPEYRIVVSTITDTGHKVARERLGGLAGVIYMPFDLPFALRRAISRVRPSVFVIIETEIWPNTFRTFREVGIPVVLLNGRLSEKAFAGYRRIRHFMKKVLEGVSLFCMQNEVYAKRITEIGADKSKVMVTGSFKFDIKLEDKKLDWTDCLSGPVVVAGSTHRGEDELLVSVYKRLKEDFGGLNFIITPRHPERFDEVEGILKSAGVPYFRRSLISGEMDIRGAAVLLDTVGELSSVYGAADVAVIGGSFIKHGGQNFLEPAYWGKPVVCGPSMENFPFVREFYDEGAAIETDNEGLYIVLKDLLSSPEKRRLVGEKAINLLNSNQGAVQKAVAALERII